MDRSDYFKNLVGQDRKNDLERFIVENLDKSDEELLDMCIEHLRSRDENASR